jgi:glycosyltransferase involved in cell wall biosynthesis
MKILYISNGVNGAGGLERVLSIKASCLAEHYKYDVSILSLNNDDKHPFYCFSDKIQFVNIKVGGNILNYVWSYVKGIQKQVDLIKPDIICVCDDGLKAFFIPQFLKTKAPIIYERHASIELNQNNSIKSKLTVKTMRYLGRYFNRFVVLSHSNAMEWSLKNVCVINNPLSFYSQEAAQLDAKKVIVVGSHSYNKGYDLLLSVWEKVFEQHPSWELTIYGRVDLNKTFIKLADNLRCKSSIYFRNPIHDIENKYLESSIFVLPSRTEGFGMVLIEAMACGLPCVSFDCPSGPRDIISHSEDGFLIENGNTTKMFEAIINLIEDVELREKMGANARNNVKRFYPNNIVQQWNDLFTDLLA